MVYNPSVSRTSQNSVDVKNVNTTAASNVSTSETDLISYTLPANSLSSNGKGVRITAWGTVAANGNTKKIKLYFGSSLFDTGTTTWTGTSWFFRLLIIRTGSSTQEMIAHILAGTTDTNVTHATPSEDTTGDIVIKTTGESGTSSDDITCEGLIVEILN